MELPNYPSSIFDVVWRPAADASLPVVVAAMLEPRIRFLCVLRCTVDVRLCSRWSLLWVMVSRALSGRPSDGEKESRPWTSWYVPWSAANHGATCCATCGLLLYVLMQRGGSGAWAASLTRS